jgi:hypothetical protein
VRKARCDAEAALGRLPWEKAYDFCERLYGHLASEVGYYDNNEEYNLKTSRREVQAYIEDELRRLFSEEGLAFDLSDCIVRRRGRKHTVDMASKAEVVLGDGETPEARALSSCIHTTKTACSGSQFAIVPEHEQ